LGIDFRTINRYPQIQKKGKYTRQQGDYQQKKRLNPLNHCANCFGNAKIGVFLKNEPIFLKNNLYTCGVISEVLTQEIFPPVAPQ
jgi:hypothetical protein